MVAANSDVSGYFCRFGRIKSCGACHSAFGHWLVATEARARVSIEHLPVDEVAGQLDFGRFSPLNSDAVALLNRVDKVAELSDLLMLSLAVGSIPGLGKHAFTHANLNAILKVFF